MIGHNLLSASEGFNRCILGREGYLVYNKNDIYGGGAIERYGEDAENEAHVLRQLCRPGDVVVDVGAHSGTRTLVFARNVGPSGYVHAYEPQRLIFQVLCANLALNSISNVDAHWAAVGAESCCVQVPNLDYTRRGNFGGVAVHPGDFGEGQRVPQVRLDEHLQLKRLNLLKVDVEGMELDVLQGADRLLRQFRPALYIENDRIEKSEALIRHLVALDYRLYWHKPAMFNPDNYFGNPENIFPNLGSFNMVGLPSSAGIHVVGMPEVRDPTEHPLRN
jgi:FkbM family methyltransferase